MTSITTRIAALQDAPLDELADEYTRLYDRTLLMRRRRPWLIKRIAWGWQAEEYGGLSPDTQARLDALMAEIDMPLGLGHGQHICLGASLARLESRIGLEELLARIPEYDVPEHGIERMHSSNVRGFSGLILNY